MPDQNFSYFKKDQNFYIWLGVSQTPLPAKETRKTLLYSIMLQTPLPTKVNGNSITLQRASQKAEAT